MTSKENTLKIMMLSCNLARWQNAPTTNMSAYRHRFNTISTSRTTAEAAKRRWWACNSQKKVVLPKVHLLIFEQETILQLMGFKRLSISSCSLQGLELPTQWHVALSFYPTFVACSNHSWKAQATGFAGEMMAFDLINNMQSCTSLYIICM